MTKKTIKVRKTKNKQSKQKKVKPKSNGKTDKTQLKQNLSKITDLVDTLKKTHNIDFSEEKVPVQQEKLEINENKKQKPTKGSDDAKSSVAIQPQGNISKKIKNAKVKQNTAKKQNRKKG